MQVILWVKKQPHISIIMYGCKHHIYLLKIYTEKIRIFRHSIGSRCIIAHFQLSCTRTVLQWNIKLYINSVGRVSRFHTTRTYRNCQSNYRRQIFFGSRNSVKLRNSVKARHHFVRFRPSFIEWVSIRKQFHGKGICNLSRNHRQYFICYFAYGCVGTF